MSEMGTLLGRPKEAKTFAPDNRWVLPKCLVGLEFEYEMVGMSRFTADAFLPTVWATHRDDSLKDHGVEFVFHQPLFGTDAYRAIHDLMHMAKEEGWKCSLRAGIHVHLDARDMETSQLIGLIILYTILEPLLYRWISENRENSIFCVPFYRANDSLIEAIALVKGVLQDEKHNTKAAYTIAKQVARYAGLNLNALAKYGSVEFRHMKTTHDFDRVIDWINIIQSLKAATYKFPTSDGAILAPQGSRKLMLSWNMFSARNLARKLWRPDADHLIQTIGIPTARDLVLYGLTEMEWLDLQPPKGKHEGFEKYLKSPIKQLIKKTELKLAKSNPEGEAPEEGSPRPSRHRRRIILRDAPLCCAVSLYQCRNWRWRFVISPT